MNNKMMLGKIEDLVKTMIDQEEEQKINTYATILTLINRIKEYNSDHIVPNLDIYSHELIWSCEALCGIDDGNNLSESHHITLALSAINKLGSYCCLNINK